MRVKCSHMNAALAWRSSESKLESARLTKCTAPAAPGGGGGGGGEEACLPEPEPPEPEACLAEELRSCVEWWRRTHRLLLRRCARWVDVRVLRAEARQWWRARWCFAWWCRCLSTALAPGGAAD